MSARSVFVAAAIAALATPLLAGYRTASWMALYHSESLSSTQTNASRLVESNPVWYQFSSDGTIVKMTGAEDPTWRAAMTGTEVLPTVQNLVNGGFDRNLAVEVLSTAENRERHAESIFQVVMAQAYDGIDIDYERLPHSSRDEFVLFLNVLAGKLHSNGKKLSVAVYGKTSDSTTRDGAGGHDYAGIGQAADYVKLMVYPYSYSGVLPGPICPLDWLDNVLTYAKSAIAPSKIVVGLPWYGKDWVGTTAQSILYDDYVALINTYNPTITRDGNGEATFTYNDHTVYFPDAYAYNKKVDLIVQSHPEVGGVTSWATGTEDPPVWERVEALKNGGGTTVTIPNPPSGLAAISASWSTANLTWVDNATDESGFKIERCAGSASSCDGSPANYAEIAQVATNVTSFEDIGLSASSTYAYRVRAFNSGGNSSYSNSSDVTTAATEPLPEPSGSTLIPAGAIWRYLDNGSNQGTAWRAVSFSDGGWPSGGAQLGYGDGDETTLISYGPDSSNKYVTIYFRYAFSLSDPASYTELTLSTIRDDGAVVYLNGTEVWRSNMPSGTIDYKTYASVGAVDDESTFYSVPVDPGLLVSGANVVAVEIHQYNASSSDISFDLKLTGTFTAVAAPSGLTAGAISSSQIALSWTDNSSNETGFSIDRCPGSGCTSFVAIATVGTNVTSYGDAGLAAGTTYTYRVRATDGGNNSSYSNSAAATTQPPPPPLAPSNLTSNAASSSQIDLAWTDGSSDETGFVIERCPGSGCTDFAQVAQISANLTAFSDTGLSSSSTYSYRVAAFNSGGNSAYSNSAAATTLAAPPPSGPRTFVASGGIWNYLDNGSDQGTAWTAIWFDESSWRSGAAQLGYGDYDETTLVSYGPDSGNKYVTTYFRASFDVADPSIYRSLKLRLLRDDGAVVYLNGQEALRSNMPTGPIGYRTYAATTTSDESTFLEFVLGADLLVAGKNVVAVEVHQADGSSSDLSFDLELIGSDALPAPSNLTASAVSTSQINLTWTDNAAGESGFQIERCGGSSSCTSFSVIATVGSNATSYSDSGIQKSTYYRYRVATLNGDSVSPYSNIATAKTPKR
jgi:spore germination protein YaaH